MVNKEVTMSIPQFFQMQRGEITLKEIKEMNTVISQMDKRLFKIMAFTSGMIMYASSVANASTVEDATSKAEQLTTQILTILQRVGLGVVIIGCILEILISVFKKNGGKDEILSLVFKWFLILASLFVVPAAFKWFAGVW